MSSEDSRWAIVPILVDSEGEVAYVEARVLDEEAQIASVPKALSKALSNVRAISEELLKTLRVLGPKRAELEIGIEFAIESGELTALLVSGSSKSNIKITLEWERGN